MKPVGMYTAASLGGISVAAVGYTVGRIFFGLGGNSTGLALADSRIATAQSVPEPETLLMLGAGLLVLVWWRHKSIARGLLR